MLFFFWFVSFRGAVVGNQGCQGEEVRFLVRTLLHNLRTGATGKTLEAAVATAIVKHRGGDEDDVAEAVAAFKVCYSQHPIWSALVHSLLEGGTARMQSVCKPTPGIPIQPMLADLCGNPEEALVKLAGKRFQASVTCPPTHFFFYIYTLVERTLMVVLRPFSIRDESY